VPAVALAGDYRWMLSASMVATVLLLRAAGRRVADARTCDLVTLALVLHPRAGFIIGTGWKEPLLAAALAAFVYFQVRAPGGIAQALAFVALPSLKQYFAVPALLWLGLR